jgi:hypothetical protein
LKVDLDKLTEKQILDLPLKDLKVSIKDSFVAPLLEQVYSELKEMGLKFKPKVWIADDWFSPDGSAGFAIPFYLLHPKLKKLEKKYIHEVEGGTKKWCLQLLRHETAHALDNAYYLRKLKTRQRLFGLSSSPYPDKYRPNPQSQNFVIHLDGFYAQAHPDEDWAETFAVWLAPRSNWKKQYANWPAIKKLEYIDLAMKRILGKPAANKEFFKMGDISKSNVTVREYYQEKQKRLKLGQYNRVIKSSVKSFFLSSASEAPSLAAHSYLRKNRRKILRAVLNETNIGPKSF